MDIVIRNTSFHDSSVTFIVNNKLFFLSLERYFQRKHFGVTDFIYDCMDKSRNFSRKNTVIQILQRNKVLSPLIRDAFYEKNVFRILKEKNASLQTANLNIGKAHHHRHAISVDFLEDTPCDVHVVIDGEGDTKWWSVYRKDKLIDCAYIYHSGGSIGQGIANAGKNSNLLPRNDHSLDTPGKYMGLQSYGELNEKLYEELLKYNMKYIGELGSASNYGYLTGKNHLFEINPNLSRKEKIDILHTIHKRAGEIILSIFEKHVLPHEKVGYSGGVAQNIIWNTMLKKRYPNLVVYPHSSDDGLSIAQLEIFRQNYSIPKEKFKLEKYPYCQYDEAPETTPSIDTIHKTAKFLADGKIVAWYQGHGEVGPRALGNRSILMDPRIPNGKDVINRVKNREHYRPFGSSVLSEYAKEYFDLDFPNPYMLYLGYTQKSNLDAITHVDGTSRAQTVDSSCDYFRTLLEHFFELTGCPVLLNTSLNEAGKPIAGWIKNAENLFASTSIDVLVVGDRIYEK